MLANVNRLGPERAAAIGAFVESGGGLLVAPGDRLISGLAEGRGWLPAKIGPLKGDFPRKQAVAHPVPRTFAGPALAPLGQGDNPPLAQADFFAYYALEPGPAPRSSPASTPATPGSSSGPSGKDESPSC